MKVEPVLLNASIGQRAKAFLYDYLVISAYLVVLVGVGSLLAIGFPSVAEDLFRSPLLGQLIAFCILTLPVVLYFALQEASQAGGSLGKKRVGLAVLTVNGQRVSLGRALLRSFVKFIPWELSHAVIWHTWNAQGAWGLFHSLGISVVWLLVAAYVLGAALGSRRTLYDLASATRVVLRQGGAGDPT